MTTSTRLSEKAALTDAPAPLSLSPDEKIAYEQLALEYAKGIGYGYQMVKGVSIPVAVSVFRDERRRIRNSAITTSSPRAGTSRPGNSRSSSQKKFVRASDSLRDLI